MITPVQSKMARAALDWGVRDLAREAQVGVSTITRFENGQGAPIPATLAAIRRALEAAGVEFIDDEAAPGVRLRAQRHSTMEEGGTDKAEPDDATETDPPHREGR